MDCFLVNSAGFRGLGLLILLLGLGLRVQGLGFRVFDLVIGFRVEGLGFRVEGLGYRASLLGRVGDRMFCSEMSGCSLCAGCYPNTKISYDAKPSAYP